MADLSVYDVDRTDDRVIAHFNVHGRREFIGDFSVEYTADDRGEYVNRDLDGYRAAGGVYADGEIPSVGLMEYAADILTEQNPTIEAWQFYTK